MAFKCILSPSEVWSLTTLTEQLHKHQDKNKAAPQASSGTQGQAKTASMADKVKESLNMKK